MRNVLRHDGYTLCSLKKSRFTRPTEVIAAACASRLIICLALEPPLIARRTGSIARPVALQRISAFAMGRIRIESALDALWIGARGRWVGRVAIHKKDAFALRHAGADRSVTTVAEPIPTNVTMTPVQPCLDRHRSASARPKPVERYPQVVSRGNGMGKTACDSSGWHRQDSQVADGNVTSAFGWSLKDHHVADWSLAREADQIRSP